MPARIVMVADVVEAMTNHRPYRPALGLDAAIAEIVACRGTKFDANVVDACIAVIEAGFIFARNFNSIAGVAD
jgi:HD-GYP domain-containing protein (c-di-GMP phosphodiesterase class II)